MSWDGIDCVVGKRGPFMCGIASLFLLQRLKGSISGDARDFNNIETQATMKFFFSGRQGAEGISCHSESNIRRICTILCHRQNWLAQFKRGDFSTCDAPHPGRPTIVTTPEIIDLFCTPKGHLRRVTKSGTRCCIDTIKPSWRWT